jgi:hypothetical protein
MGFTNWFLPPTYQSDMEELESLRQAQREDEEQSEAKRLQKRISDLQEEHEDTLDAKDREHERELNKIKLENSNVLEDKETEIGQLKRSNGQLMKELGDDAKRDEKHQATKKELDERDAEIASKEVELTEREKRVEAREKALGDLDEVLSLLNKKHNDELDEAYESGSKKGYADGVSDGLREVHKLQAEDRKLIETVTMLLLTQEKPADLVEQLGTIVKENLKDVLTQRVIVQGKDGKQASNSQK